MCHVTFEHSVNSSTVVYKKQWNACTRLMFTKITMQINKKGWNYLRRNAIAKLNQLIFVHHWNSSIHLFCVKQPMARKKLTLTLLKSHTWLDWTDVENVVWTGGELDEDFVVEFVDGGGKFLPPTSGQWGPSPRPAFLSGKRDSLINKATSRKNSCGSNSVVIVVVDVCWHFPCGLITFIEDFSNSANVVSSSFCTTFNFFDRRRRSDETSSALLTTPHRRFVVLKLIADERINKYYVETSNNWV